jgi:hypothetical protein
VFIPGKPPVTTDASGAFSISGVSTPYDIAVVDAENRYASVYKGVTRQNITLGFTPDVTPVISTASVSGSITGAQTPSATVREPQVVFGSPESLHTQSPCDPASSSYQASIPWMGSPSTTGTLFAFQGERASSSSPVYTRFTGFGRRDAVSLTPGTTLVNQNVSLSPVTSSTLAATFTTPSGFTLTSIGLDMQLEPGVRVPLLTAASPSSSFSSAVPVIGESTYSLTTVAAALSSGTLSMVIRSGLTAGTQDVNIALKEPTKQALPLDKATEVTRTSEFTWGGSPGGVYVVTFTSSGGTPYRLGVFTSAANITLPDLSALGMAVPANTPFTWNVLAYSPISSVDAMVVDVEGGPTRISDNRNLLFMTSSGSRQFTTAATP